MSQELGVLVVDDSAFMRKIITEIINKTDDFTVIDTARDGQDALDKIQKYGLQVQLVTLDIQMPGMDGLSCLKHIMSEHPRRVVMVSSLTTEGAKETLEALELGAVDFLAKPGGAISVNFAQVGSQLVEILRTAASTKLGKPTAKPTAVIRRQPQAAQVTTGTSFRKLVAVASSTGGPKALASFIPALPKDLPAALVIVQHMPATFTRLLAERLDRASRLKVKEAAEGDRLLVGLCLIAPGGYHMEITADETVHLTKEPPIGGLRPCADITFRTIADVFGKRATAVVLTGMGHDGTSGCRIMKSRGSFVLTESAETALIYGMPKCVASAGLSDEEVPIHSMAQAVVDQVDRM